jgi:hypothetical protein
VSLLTWLFVVPILAATPIAPRAPITPTAPSAPKAAARTFCAEWIRQSHQGFERFTVFTDSTLVWKTVRDGADEVRRKKLEPAELSFYCAYFTRPEVWELSEDLRTGLAGDFAPQSTLTLARPDGSRKQLRFDDLSALPAGAGALRSALEGLKLTFLSPLAPASRFTPETLPPGTLLRRFDGEMFRVRQVISEKGVIELEGVLEPYSEFKKIEELRFQFAPPE